MLKSKIKKIECIRYSSLFIRKKELDFVKTSLIINEEKVITSNQKGMSELQYRLGLYMDNDNLLRLKGRLQNSGLEFQTKYPIYLDKDSYLTHLFIMECHQHGCV